MFSPWSLFKLTCTMHGEVNCLKAPFLPGILESDEPVILITAEHLRTGKNYDAALIWTENVTKDAFEVCLRELQNFDGKHEDISVVCSS